MILHKFSLQNYSWIHLEFQLLNDVKALLLKIWFNNKINQKLKIHQKLSNKINYLFNFAQHFIRILNTITNLPYDILSCQFQFKTLKRSSIAWWRFRDIFQHARLLLSLSITDLQKRRGNCKNNFVADIFPLRVQYSRSVIWKLATSLYFLSRCP